MTGYDWNYNPFRVANGKEVNQTEIAKLVKDYPLKAQRLAQEAGYDKAKMDRLFPPNPR